MAFLIETDYDATIYAEILTAITRSDSSVKETAEAAAISEMKSYLSSRYDTTAIFAATGSQRDAVIVMFCKDIAVYHMHSISNPNKLPDVRKDRYNAAIDWLKQVSRLKINPPGLPISQVAEKQYVLYGSNDKRNNYY